MSLFRCTYIFVILPLTHPYKIYLYFIVDVLESGSAEPELEQPPQTPEPPRQAADVPPSPEVLEVKIDMERFVSPVEDMDLKTPSVLSAVSHLP